jgi:hypothetical protein
MISDLRLFVDGRGLMRIGFPFCVFLQKKGAWVCQEEHQQSGLTRPSLLMVSLMGHRVGRLQP